MKAQTEHKRLSLLPSSNFQLAGHHFPRPALNYIQFQGEREEHKRKQCVHMKAQTEHKRLTSLPPPYLEWAGQRKWTFHHVHPSSTYIFDRE